MLDVRSERYTSNGGSRNAFQVHYGRCRLQCFWSVTDTVNKIKTSSSLLHQYQHIFLNQVPKLYGFAVPNCCMQKHATL